MHPIVTFVTEAFQAKSDHEKARKMEKYLKSDIPMFGVPSADQKKIHREAFKKYPPIDFNEYLTVINEFWKGGYRDDKWTAISYAKKFPEFQTMEALPTYRMMIETGAWWDLVDTIAADLTGSLLKKYPEEMKPELKRWIKDEHLWIRRTAILSQLKFKQAADAEMLFDFCRECIGEKSFWIRKSIGWALREYSKTDPDSVREFIEKYKDDMSGLTYREASKYI